MAILLKAASVRVSSNQIMQVRVQNKVKSVWKSRCDGDVSTDSRDPPGRSVRNVVILVANVYVHIYWWM